MTQKRITGLSAEDLEALFLLVPRILCDYRDPRRGPFKLAYLYAQTVDNEDSAFMRAVELVNSEKVKAIGTSEGDKGAGYEGYDHSVARLKDFGLKGGVLKFDIGGNVNTGSEAQKLAEWAKGNAGGGQGGGDIAVVAPPFHIVRAFMTTVTAFRRNSAIVRVYAIPGARLSWTEEAVHSQGTLKKKRAELLASELKRLEDYRAPKFGSMLSAQEVLNYLDWRDG